LIWELLLCLPSSKANPTAALIYHLNPAGIHPGKQEAGRWGVASWVDLTSNSTIIHNLATQQNGIPSLAIGCEGRAVPTEQEPAAAPSIEEEELPSSFRTLP